MIPSKSNKYFFNKSYILISLYLAPLKEERKERDYNDVTF